MTLELKRYKDDFFNWSTEPYRLGGVKQIGTVANHPEYIFIEIFIQRIFNPEIFEYIKDAENGTVYVQEGKWVQDNG